MFGRVIVTELLGLKSKMYFMKETVGKECNTAKRMNVATEFNKFKDVLFKEKIIRHKMKRIQSKKHKLGTYEINRILVYTLSYFHKNSITRCEAIKKYFN